MRLLKIKDVGPGVWIGHAVWKKGKRTVRDQEDDDWRELCWLVLKATYRPPTIAERLSEAQIGEPLGAVARRIEQSAMEDRGGSVLDQALEHLSHVLSRVRSFGGNTPEQAARKVLTTTADLKTFQIALVWLSKRVDGTRPVREYLL
jgi:hypothetical protein